MIDLFIYSTKDMITSKPLWEWSSIFNFMQLALFIERRNLWHNMVKRYSNFRNISLCLGSFRIKTDDERRMDIILVQSFWKEKTYHTLFCMSKCITDHHALWPIYYKGSIHDWKKKDSTLLWIISVEILCIKRGNFEHLFLLHICNFK